VPLKRAASVLAIAGLAFGCTDMVRVTETPAVATKGLAIRRLAVAPFRVVQRPSAAPIPSDVGGLVAGFAGEGLARRGVDVVPATDVAQGLGMGDEAALPDTRTIVQAAAQKFGADTVAVGSVTRWRERSGEAAGTMEPASVGFEVKLYSAANGALLWAGAFDETQVALSLNVLKASQYPGGGMRWLTAEEFARFGADQVTMKVPLATP